MCISTAGTSSAPLSSAPSINVQSKLQLGRAAFIGDGNTTIGMVAFTVKTPDAETARILCKGKHEMLVQ